MKIKRIEEALAATKKALQLCKQAQKRADSLSKKLSKESKQ